MQQVTGTTRSPDFPYFLGHFRSTFHISCSTNTIFLFQKSSRFKLVLKIHSYVLQFVSYRSKTAANLNLWRGLSLKLASWASWMSCPFRFYLVHWKSEYKTYCSVGSHCTDNPVFSDLNLQSASAPLGLTKTMHKEASSKILQLIMAMWGLTRRKPPNSHTKTTV